MKTFIKIERMKFHARHGVSEQERMVGNDFEVSVELCYPFEASMETDHLADTLNYAEAYDIVAAEMAVPSQLLENVAGRIIKSLTSRFPLIKGGKVTVAKITPPITGEMASVAVTVEF